MSSVKVEAVCLVHLGSRMPGTGPATVMNEAMLNKYL